MADSESNGSGRNRRELALVEVEAICTNMLVDLRIMIANVESILAEAREARR